jgi:hypothetical protein
MYEYGHWKPDARTEAYATPCGRYSVERTGNERFEVYGPEGFLDWFVMLAAAKEFADWQAEQNPVKATRSNSRK